MKASPQSQRMERRYQGILDDERAIAWSMQEFALRLGGVTEKMRVLRPDLVDADYDLQLDGSRLVILDDSLDERSRIWLEESFNGDRELVRLARAVNDEAAHALDINRHDDTSGRNTYKGVDATIDRSVRFLSALKRTMEMEEGCGWTRRYAHAALVLERQVMEDTYIYRAKGGAVELERNLNRSSLFEVDLHL
ncbi:hypothetical protein [Luteibacter yeojuensis]|nr:hypothetical protein [Luteibacter yeojuensis]